MSFDGSHDPTTRPLPQGTPPSPYGAPGGPGQQPYGGGVTQPYGVVPGGQPSQGAGGQGEPPQAGGSFRPWSGRPTQSFDPATEVFDSATEVFDPATQVFDPATGAFRSATTPQGAMHDAAAREVVQNGTPPPASPRPPRTGRGWRSPAFLVPAVIGVLLVLGAGATFAVVKLRGPQLQDPPAGTPSATGRAATLPAGRTWLSGAWTGGTLSAKRINAFGAWRGQPADVVTTYPAYKTWDELKNKSDWHVSTLDGFAGRISYGLPLLPKDDAGSLHDVAEGKYDDVFRSVAQVLNKHHREDAFVRIGLEANGTWFPWGADAGKAENYKDAWRHVQKVMKEVSPKLSFGFDITCGKALEGGAGRMDSLNKLYPGDDVVDVIGCDHYDSYTVKSRNQDEWAATQRPASAAGLADVADFARAHHKQLAVPEWGLTSKAKDGAGDDPYFIYSMYQFFVQNKDILAYENYFNEADDSLGSAIWDSGQNPKSADEYKKLWGAAPNLQKS